MIKLLNVIIDFKHAGHERVVEFLLEHGADVNAREKDGWTPMNVVAHKSNFFSILKCYFHTIVGKLF